MESNQIDKLLIENIADMDEGAQRLDALSVNIAESMDDIVQDWAEKNEWMATTAWNETDDLSVAPKNWVPSDDEWLAWFGLDTGKGEEGDEWHYFWLARLCGVGRGEYGFRFFQDEYGRVPWKKFIRELAPPSNSKFNIDDEPSLFMPIKVDKDALAKAAEDGDFRQALEEPLFAALNHIKDNVQFFQSLRDEMAKRQGSS